MHVCVCVSVCVRACARACVRVCVCGLNILSRMQTSVFELLTCVVWACPECYVMQERCTGIEAEYG